MTRLPQPSTASPGFITLLYNNSVNQHKVSVRLIAGVDITDLTSMRTAATNLATKLALPLPNTVEVTDWVLENADRVELFREAFPSPHIGGTSYGTSEQSDSFTVDFPGRGQPAIGLAQGNTRFMFFLNVWDNTWTETKKDFSAVTNLAALVTDLNGSSVYGADIYGSKAHFSPVADLQFNAHWQKKQGF